MSIKIKPLRKFTTGTPSTSDMVEGELAVNTADKKVFMRDDSNNIVEVANANSTLAADNITAGDAAVNITTTTGNITIDAQGSDTDIIFKGTDNTTDITALRLDMSNAGKAIFGGQASFGKELLVDMPHGGTYTKPAQFLVNDMGVGDRAQFTFGKALSASNLVEFGYYHAGDGSSDNLVSIGFYGSGATARTVQRPDGKISFGSGDTGTAFFNEVVNVNGGIWLNGSIVFEGSSEDAFETTLAVTNPTGSDKTITLPNATGTVALTSQLPSTALDDIGAGDAAVNLTTSTGNITIDAQGSDTDIIFKGTDGSSDITALTLDMSDAGTAIFNHNITMVDNAYINIGTGDGGADGDLRLRSNGTNGYVEHLGAGSLVYKSNTHSFRNKADDEQLAKFTNGGAVEFYYDDSKKFETTATGVKTTGTLSSNATINKYGSSSNPIVFTVTVATQTAAHPYNGDGSTNKYSIDGVEGAALTLHGADNKTVDSQYYYRFDQSAGSNATHPLRFYLEADKTTAYTTGVTTNGTPGQAGAYTQIAITQDTPQILYYQCSSHAYMGNYIIVPHSTNIKQNAGNITLNAVGGNIQLNGDTGNSVKIAGALETTGNIELGHGSDTTISRSSAGTVQIEGATVLTENSSIGDLSNVSITGISDAQVLKWNNGAGRFEAGTLGHSFKTIAVTGTAGQSNVVADAEDDTLTFAAGSNMTITTNASGDTITFASSAAGGGSSAADDITTGDAAVTIATSSGDITIDNQANNQDIIFKGTDAGNDITALTLDMSAGGNAKFSKNINLESDGAILRFGSDKEIEVTHVHNTSLLLTNAGTGTPAVELQFVDSNESIGSDGTNLILTSGGTSFKMPTSDGTGGHFLRTDGAGNFSFAAASGGGGGGSTAADDLTAGDAAINLTTSTGNITIDAQGSDTDIVFKGTDGSSDITALTLDMSDAGKAIFNAGAQFGGFGGGSFFSVRGTAELRTSGGDILIRASSASTRAELHFNGSEKLVTNTNGVAVTGLLTATTKSFDIKHPTKEHMRLRYGVLEGPEHGVYIRGKLINSNVIELPEYWTGLVDEDTITVQLTPIGKFQKLYVKEISDNKIIIGNGSFFSNNTECFYTVQGTRKDVDELEIEYEN